MFEAKLGDIIQVYGNPSHIEANNVGQTSSISFLWFSQGLSVAMTGEYKDKPPIINTSLTVKYVRVFVPTTPEKYVEGGVVKAEQFVSWQGYKDFGFYCNLSMPSHKC